MVLPKENADGSTSVACWLLAFVNGSELMRILCESTIGGEAVGPMGGAALPDPPPPPHPAAKATAPSAIAARQDKSERFDSGKHMRLNYQRARTTPTEPKQGKPKKNNARHVDKNNI